MKRVFLLIVSFITFSCGGGQKSTNEALKLDSYEESYNLFIKAIEAKDISILKAMSAASFPEFDTLLTKYSNPKVRLVPKQPDGAFGIIDNGYSQVYYLFVTDSDILQEVRVLQLKLDGGKYKIWNYTPFKITDKVLQLYAEEDASAQTNFRLDTSHHNEVAKVTNVDRESGESVNRVNMWSSTNYNTRKVVGYCVNNEEVEVLDRSNNYVKVRKKDGTEGWFMEGWLKK